MALSLETVLLVSGVLWMAASLQGITGFGFNMIAVPVLILFYAPQVVVPGTLMAYLPLGSAQVLLFHRDIDRGLWATFVCSAIFAIPLGALILRDTDTETMRRGIGAMMVVMALLLQVRPGNPFRRDSLARISGGFISGALASSTGVSGPPVVLLGIKQAWPHRAFRATLLSYFLAVSILSLPFHWHLDLVNDASLTFALAGVPGLILGFYTGAWLRKWIDARRFRWVAICMVLAGGLTAVLM